MQVTLIKSQVIKQFTLPEKVQGLHWITHDPGFGGEEQLFSVEATDGGWYIKSSKRATLQDANGAPIKGLMLEPMRFYGAALRTTGENAFLFTEPLTDDRRTFRKFITPANGVLRIGRADDNDIIYHSPFASGHHAELRCQNGSLTVADCGSRNGTFVDGVRVSRKPLAPGETVYMMGLKILIGRGFISLNNPDRSVKVIGRQLRQFNKQEASDWDGGESVELKPETVFYRSPRFKRDIESEVITVDPPPSKANAEQLPLILTIGPSATMAIASLAMVSTTIIGIVNGTATWIQSIPMLAMAVAMLGGTLVWPTIIKRYEKKKREGREKLRQEKYIRYLDSVNRQIAETCERQSEILCENFVPLNTCLSRIKLMQRNLWERTVSNNDFLSLRIGLGRQPLQAEIRGQKRKFSLDDDNLMEMHYRISEQIPVLNNVPITVTLPDDVIVGLIGPRDSEISLIRSLILQMVALHSYDEVKLVLIYDPQEESQWEFVRWLPHVWSENRGMRYIASSAVDVKELSSFFEREHMQRLSQQRDYSRDIVPHYVFIALDQELAERTEMVKQIYRSKVYVGFSVLAVYNEINNLPKECRRVIELSPTKCRMYDKEDIGGEYIDFVPEYCVQRDISDYAIALSNIKLDTSVAAYQLPSMMTFLEMYGVGKVEYLNILSRWKENDPTVSLEAPIGVDTNGELFRLDMHERFHGPHGLIAGTTGSGKSEFIMTYILSMAMNYHPYEVAFILIDYKGGGMAKAFERLPHTAGIITNLDGAEVNRSLVSINSELKRRQALFSETGKRIGASNIDIYKYQKMYREGTVREPLPHLLIISDEFAELKQQQPEFMTELISAARIGRSLGVHLVLATQKPTGVVDDQIMSNTRFKICLKVQDRQDSMEMLRRPEAADITQTGRFFLQVGNNEIFMLGQSAWSGAAYTPADKIKKQVDNSIAVVTNTGRVLKQMRMGKSRERSLGSQLDVITGHISKMAAEEGIRTRQLWCAPMPAVSTLKDIIEKYGLPEQRPGVIDPVIGQYDLPEAQTQKLLTLPLTEQGNALIYGSSGSGKSTFMSTLAYSLIETYTPEQVNIYILDFLSQTLAAFRGAPQVGDVVLSDNGEKLDNLFKLLFGELRRRRQMFQEYGGDYVNFMRSSGSSLPAIVVMIHNYTGLIEAYEEKDDAVAQLAREGSKYGIYVVLSALSVNAVRHRTLQSFGQLFVLRMNDIHDYSAVLGNTGGLAPSKHKGRGLFKPGGIYEFQTAYCTDDAEEFRFIRSYCQRRAEEWTGETAKAVPILPDYVNLDFLRPHLRRAPENSLPVAVDKDRLTVVNYPLYKTPLTWVISDSGNNLLFAQALAEIAAERGDAKVMVLDPSAGFRLDPGDGYTYCCDTKAIERGVSALFAEMLRRHKALKEDPSASFARQLCVITSMSSLLTVLSEEKKNNLLDALEHTKQSFNFHLVVCDSSMNYNSYINKPWAKEQTSARDILFVGNGIHAQFKLQIEKKPASIREAMPDGFGVVLSNGTAVQCKLAIPRLWQDDSGEFDG